MTLYRFIYLIIMTTVGLGTSHLLLKLMLFAPFHHWSHGGTAAMALYYSTTMGLNKDHKVTKNMSMHSCRHGHLTKQTKFMQDRIWELRSFIPYQQYAMELFKVSKDKCALKVIKKSVGTHIHAKRKKKELSNDLAAMSKEVAKKDWTLPPLYVIKPFWNLKKKLKLKIN